jgi:RHS repeat-associated protein
MIHLNKFLQYTSICLFITSIYFFVSSLNLNAQITDFSQYSTNNYLFSRVSLLKSSGGTDYRESFNYFDGLGRKLQFVYYKGSPLFKDIVQPFEYDEFNRVTNTYLAYPDLNSSGKFRTTWKADQASRFTTLFGSVDGTKAFSATIFDYSPLNIVIKQGFEGDLWKIISTSTVRQSSEHILSYQYVTNASNEVYYWTIGGNFPNIVFTRHTFLPNTLEKNVILDENNNQTIEYYDKNGNLVLKVDALLSKTYFIYDEFDQLRCVLTPLASNYLPSFSSFNLDNLSFQELCYYFEYDERQRLITKKIPGTVGYYSYHYDDLDRIDFYDDPNGVRTFYTYDIFSRLTKSEINGPSSKLMQTKAFYDSYMQGIDYSLNFPYQNTYYSSFESSLKNKLTITVNNIINSETGMKPELVTVIYYDKYGRIIQTQKENYLGGRDITSYYYKYTNSDIIEKKMIKHWKTNFVPGSPNCTIEEIYSYDNAGRLLTTDYILNGTSLRMSELLYDETGSIQQKKIENSLQIVNYKYNIRGWLTQMNNPSSYNINTLFAEQLSYNTGNYYNGNISRIEWKNNNLGTLVKRYDLGYDKLDRLQSSSYAEYDNGVYMPNSGGKYIENCGFDANGNITSISRNGIVDDGTGLVGTIDVLTYKYYNNQNSNKLWSVGDYIPDIFGRGDFNESNSDGNSNQEYYYDNNGNMTWDKNRKSKISYNYLDLPYNVWNETGPPLLSFIYSSDGTKIRQIYYKNTGQSNEIIDYIGPIVYKNGILDYIMTDEGRAVFSNGNFSYYEFYLKDHLGNIRTVIKRNGTSPQVLQTNNYYPFGMLMGESTGKTYSNKYRYNGKENLIPLRTDYPTDLNLYDYGARLYDPQLGGFHSNDPMAVFTPEISPYSYANDNPISYIDYFGLFGKGDREKRRREKKTEHENKRRTRQRDRQSKERDRNEGYASHSGHRTYHAYVPKGHSVPEKKIKNGLDPLDPISGLLPVPEPDPLKILIENERESHSRLPHPPPPNFPIPEAGKRLPFARDILFQSSRDNINDFPSNYAILDALVKTLNDYDYVGLKIYGNVMGDYDITGNSHAALDQDTRLNGQWTNAGTVMNARAYAVFQYLISKGIDPKRLTYGQGNVFNPSSDPNSRDMKSTSFESFNMQK